MTKSLLTIDKSLCDRCGLCALDCPRAIIKLTAKGGLPEVPEGFVPLCIACGHCVAVCPHGALDHAGVPLDACPKSDGELTVGKAQAAQFLRSRRSIRVFKPVAVERGLLQELIETARYAPSAMNAQPLTWTVVSGREKLEEVVRLTVAWMQQVSAAQPDSLYAQYFAPLIQGWQKGYDGVLRHAHTLVVASAPKAAATGLVDCTLALSYLELAALPLGLGTCWAGLLQMGLLEAPAVRDAVGLPAGHTWHYPMMVGYPKLRYPRLPARREPRIVWK